VSAGCEAQFGHSGAERLRLTNIKRESDFYSLNAEINSGAFRGAAKVFGHASELEQLHQALSELSGNLSGEVEFENLEGQLKLRCTVGTTGVIHFEIALTDHRDSVECAFDSDPETLGATIEALAAHI
jgi:hypothetical protein